MRRGAEERQDGGIRLRRPGTELLRREREHLLAREALEPPLELVRVEPAGHVRVVPPGEAERLRVGAQPLDLTTHALVLRLQRILEGQRLAAERDLVLVVRVRALRGLAHEQDQPHVGHERVHALRPEWVEHVARARLADELALAPERQLTAVPCLSAPPVAVEEADLLPERAGDLRMPPEVRVERRGPGLLRPDHQEVR